ncbi:beta-lactamase family protein [Chitinophaga horti]|uniref:Beta-lactamase family protein n=1 Tax=Chitinophaga horti TaxID=2920382 RepID=A0ABY6IVR1_9BACT|nr:serine hydrolase domain-containing protein [Chitinophaga horti]UYQ91461.1 beta-lactamase family protein [Chitinophaga horti]
MKLYLSFLALLLAGPICAQDTLIDSLFTATEPGGVILVARGDQVVYERAFGMANMELNVPMRREMVFNIGSVTKQFTAIAILQLVEQGKLSLQDTVGSFLKGYVGGQATVAQLLTHTAGIPNAASAQSLIAKGRGWLSAADVMSTFKDQPLTFVPGTNWAYSNSGYQLLGYIIEQVSNMSYEDYITRQVLQPAGMAHALFGNDMWLVPNRASSYIYTRRGVENAVNANAQIPYSAGALQATAADIFAWYRSVTTHKMVQPTTLQQAWSRARITSGRQPDYGFGWTIGHLGGHPLVEHSGNFGGFMSHVMYFPKDSLLVCVLFNFRRQLPEILATRIAGRYLGVDAEYTPVALHATQLATYAGNYLDDSRTTTKLGFENGRLFYQKPGGPKWWIVPVGKDLFNAENTSTLFQFVRNKNGSIMRLDIGTTRNTDKYSLTPAP